MKPISCNQEMGDTERLLCPGELCKVLLGITGRPSLLDPQISTNFVLVFLRDHHPKHFVSRGTKLRSRKAENKRPREQSHTL